VQVQGINDAIDVSAGAQHTCAIRANGSVMCWGINGRSEQGAPSVRATWSSVVGLH
jgi:alpha-tubulin suppressor-like RCC1 family protein